MNLKSVKLSGFKSFVDPTVIPVRSNMNAIVGPNGCGKSNVIDAIRWVIGESSAKQLRGQLMSDVIFNGTSTRKPVGKASVELNFTNTEGRITGEFASYTEISVKREVERDGQSNYFINGTACRRKDIIDIFLGTGLGPRSYAIIEQGMVSRLIEAKPEDLRIYLEEAAGISKYKERRRETETRIRHTQENLERLHDIMEELEKQLRHLKRQANAAERYKVLKSEERLLAAQIKALHWQSMSEQLATHEDRCAQQETRVEAQKAKLSHVATEIEKGRVLQTEYTEQQNAVQKRYYGLGAEIARIEEQIKNTQAQTERWKNELDDANSIWQELEENSSEQRQQVVDINSQLQKLTPQTTAIHSAVNAANEQLAQAESAMGDWQQRWDEYQAASSKAQQLAEVSRTNIRHLEQQLTRLQARMEHLQERLQDQSMNEMQSSVAPLAARVETLESQLTTVKEQIENLAQQIYKQRGLNATQQKQLEETRKALQSKESRHAQLEGLQQAALGAHDRETQAWLEQQQLNDRPRLAKNMRVQSGWELAAETVLKDYFDAICTQDVSEYLDGIQTLTAGRTTLIDQQANRSSQASIKASTLASVVQSDWLATEYLNGIYIVDTIQQAREMRSRLQSNESIITKDGIWLGLNWLRVSKASDSQDSVLIREQELTSLFEVMAEIRNQLQGQQEVLQQGVAHLVELERQSDTQNQTYRDLSAELTSVRSEFSSKEAHVEAWHQQQQRLNSEYQECEQQIEETHQASAEAKAQLEDSEVTLERLVLQRDALANERDEKRGKLDQAREYAQRERQRADELGIRISANENQLQLLKQTLERAERQMVQLKERRENLAANLQETDGPMQRLQDLLQGELDKRLTIEQELHLADEQLEQQNQKLKQYENERQAKSNELTELQTALQELSMQRQAISIRQTTIVEQLAETDFVLETLLAEMPEEAETKAWESRLEAVGAQINRLGPINLAAIEEYDQTLERKEYLDKQHADLTEALQVLGDAIRKIDRETRSKFRETFEKVNEHFQNIFPRMFGGGKASLELSEDDLLTAGIHVRAQPPGKRNSTIHMLSGGEKALTAISLVFSMFQLNPAPFCILDEVDAPLDDLNVGRYCQLVKEMSKNTQFLVISHNKVTIEAADYLMGVTMQEPGVSRIVSVDMAEAMEMVEA